MLKSLIVVVLCITLSSAAQTRATPMEAIAYVTGPVQDDGSQAKGTVTFTQNACGENVHVTVVMEGLKEGKHGFHIHEKGDLSNGCASMAAHYNPDKMDHGGQHHEIRHVGDLGNIVADNRGVVNTTISDSVINLAGKYSIIGRGCVVHEQEDDEGLGNHTDSKKTGNAGGRVACGVIGVNWDFNEWPCRDGGASMLKLSMSIVVLITAFFVSQGL